MFQSVLNFLLKIHEGLWGCDSVECFPSMQSPEFDFHYKKTSLDMVHNVKFDDHLENLQFEGSLSYRKQKVEGICASAQSHKNNG